ncbi:DNA/RNA helicase domain-containing protein [Bacillus thuringiensis]|uniref:DNA/RNA helicase domain-containing protein n=1 Tax=Bacillus thuringiensis TaxID=1428 RepID=UPI001CF9CEDD|nr:DNA/RNA helicase domain-containing protein [Bacillus thuringiensis]
MNYGWAGTIEQFKQLDVQFFVKQLLDHVYKTNTNDSKIASQKKAWIDSFNKLQDLFNRFSNLDASLIFEYEILRGGGRRPDVLLLINGYLIVLECKSYNNVSPSEYIQTSLYMRDLEHYHSAIQESNMQVIGVLLLTNYEGEHWFFQKDYQVTISTVDGLESILKRILNKTEAPTLTLEEIINGVYEPSPSMLEAARSILNNEPLPDIKAVSSSNFPAVQQTVRSIIEEAQHTNTHHLILVSGEPGAGKTYLGLTIAHEMKNAVYLSGNGPLVDVLQDTLKNRTFVQGLYGYKMDFLEKRMIPKEQIIIFDEAQRAWDTKKVDQSLTKRNRKAQNLSEPDIIMNIATNNKPWSVTIGLIGDGQEIYSGEEGGLALWNHAIAGKNVTVHSKHPNSFFTNTAHYRTHSQLHLNSSFRAHAALKYYEIINTLLDANFEQTKQLIHHLPKEHYQLFITRDLNKAKLTLHQLYQDDTKTAGVVCAGGADRQKEVPVLPRDERYERPSKIAQYFNYSESQYYCRALNYSSTEFQTQGLELDMTLVHWDNDLYLQNETWKGRHYQWGVEDPFQIKLNAYRVILTRGRDGTIIYIPPKPILDETWNLFKNYLHIPELMF